MRAAFYLVIAEGSIGPPGGMPSGPRFECVTRPCTHARPDLGERWPARLVATAAEDRLNFQRYSRRPVTPVGRRRLASITRAPCRKVVAARHQKDAPAAGGAGASRDIPMVVGLRPTLTIYTCWLTRTLHGGAAPP